MGDLQGNWGRRGNNGITRWVKEPGVVVSGSSRGSGGPGCSVGEGSAMSSAEGLFEMV